MLSKKRNGKKKSLTEAIKLIPFPNQSLRTTNTPVQNKPSVSPERILPTPKVEPKTLSQPTGELNTQHVSIKQVLHQSKQQQQQPDWSNMPATPFDLDQLKMAWKQLAFKMKEDGFDTIYFALNKRDPQLLNQFEIHHQVDNQVQADQIESNRGELLDFLRKKLNNWSLDIFLEVNINHEEDKRLLSGKDRFDELAKRNANLHSLLKTFNLDIDL